MHGISSTYVFDPKRPHAPQSDIKRYERQTVQTGKTKKLNPRAPTESEGPLSKRDWVKCDFDNSRFKES